MKIIIFLMFVSYVFFDISIFKTLILGMFSFVFLKKFNVVKNIKSKIKFSLLENKKDKVKEIGFNYRYNIEQLEDVIDIIKFYSLRNDKFWTPEKVKFVKNIFYDFCFSEKDLLFLKNKLKSKNNINIDVSIERWLKKKPTIELRKNIFCHVSKIILESNSNIIDVFNDSRKFAKNIGVDEGYCIQYFNEFCQEIYFVENQSINDLSSIMNNYNLEIEKYNKDIKKINELFLGERNKSKELQRKIDLMDKKISELKKAEIENNSKNKDLLGYFSFKESALQKYESDFIKKQDELLEKNNKERLYLERQIANSESDLRNAKIRESEMEKCIENLNKELKEFQKKNEVIKQQIYDRKEKLDKTYRSGEFVDYFYRIEKQLRVSDDLSVQKAIDMSYQYGVISKKLRDRLHEIRQIRNDVIHNGKTVSKNDLQLLKDVYDELLHEKALSV